MELENLINKQIYQYKNTALLIGSANYPFSKVLLGKTYPFDLNAAEYTLGNRIFPGCEILDQIEKKGIEYSKKFLQLGNEYGASLSLYSGTQANQVVYNAILKPDDRVLVFSEESGGHASHISFLKKYYQLIEYKFSLKNEIDYEAISYLIQQYKPKLVIAGSTLYPESINYRKLSEFCKINNSLLLADISHTALYVATGEHDPVRGYADFITYTTHKTTRGIRSAVLNYKKDFEKEIIDSLSSVSQGAPKYSDVLCNTIMFEELNNLNSLQYQNSIFRCTSLFKSMASELGLTTIGTGKSHMLLLNLQKGNLNGDFLKNLYESNNIYVTYHKTIDGEVIRFGFLTLATLGFTTEDLIKLYEIILNLTIHSNNSQNKYKEDVGKIINKYTDKFYRENYKL